MLTANHSLPLQVEKTDRKKRELKMGIGKYFKANNKSTPPAPTSTATPPAMGKPNPEVAAKAKRKMTLGQRIAAKD